MPALALRLNRKAHKAAGMHGGRNIGLGIFSARLRSCEDRKRQARDKEKGLSTIHDQPASGIHASPTRGTFRWWRGS
jgi:hypothetical protein